MNFHKSFRLFGGGRTGNSSAVFFRVSKVNDILTILVSHFDCKTTTANLMEKCILSICNVIRVFQFYLRVIINFCTMIIMIILLSMSPHRGR